jgi:hypothetical protein
MIPELNRQHTVLVLYDLRDPEAWTEAHAASERWGRERTSGYPIDLDHVVVEFHADDFDDEAQEVSA